MSKLALKSNEGGTGTVLLAAPVVDTDITVTLPSRSGVISLLEKDIADYSVNGVKFGTKAKADNYAICSNSASTVAKTATLDGFTLTEGAQITVLFGNGNTASNPTLSVNGGTAIPLLFNGANLNATAIKANDIVTFVYDGTSFRGIGGMAIRDGGGNVIATTYLKTATASSTYAKKTDLTDAQNTLNATITTLTNRVTALETSVNNISSEITSIKSNYMTKSEYQAEVDAAFAALS